jgi:hypothetical protein
LVALHSLIVRHYQKEMSSQAQLMIERRLSWVTTTTFEYADQRPRFLHRPVHGLRELGNHNLLRSTEKRCSWLAGWLAGWAMTMYVYQGVGGACAQLAFQGGGAVLQEGHPLALPGQLCLHVSVSFHCRRGAVQIF